MRESSVNNHKDHTAVFDVKDLSLWYNHGKKQALKNVSIKIERNKVIALIGPSGCGKSTFLRCLNKMNDLIEGTKITGSIRFNDRWELINSEGNLFEKMRHMLTPKMQEIIKPIELRTRVGMVFQKPNPFPTTIFENVAYGPRTMGITKKSELFAIVKSSLENAALWDEVKDQLYTPAMRLSGGQQQRLCIARAIAIEPEVLLLDEPTSALDPISTSKIEKLMHNLKKKYTLIIVTHSLQQAARVSDSTAFFYYGKIIEYDKTQAIFTHPKEKLTSDYINGRMG